MDEISKSGVPGWSKGGSQNGVQGGAFTETESAECFPGGVSMLAVPAEWSSGKNAGLLR